MGFLTRRSGGEVDHPQRGSGITGQDVHDTEFSGNIVQFDSLGVVTPPEVGPQVAAAVTDDPRPRQRNGKYYRRRRGWRAGRGGILVVDLHQPLMRRPDGKLTPTGDYAIASADVHLVTEPARRRLGAIPTEQGGTSGGAKNGMLVAGATPADEALALLPEPARVALIRHVPNPAVYDADAIAFNGGERYVVSALRLDDTRAAVVVGTLNHGDPTWQVEHVTYSLRPGSEVLITREPRRTGLLDR